MTADDRIRRQVEFATGDFASFFQGFDLPPLPSSVERLLAEIHSSEPDVGRLEQIISATPELAARVLRTVNSSLYALGCEVKSVRHAITQLGIRNIRSLALSYAMKSAVPRPHNGLFDHEAFWVDSLTRALFARSLSRKNGKGEPEEAFTVTLLSDLALPLLLDFWSYEYASVLRRWRHSPERLSSLERKAFGWDHAQAGAWILQLWRFPPEIICYVSLHGQSLTELRRMDLEDTIAVPVAAACRMPSVLRLDPERAHRMVMETQKDFSLSAQDFTLLVEKVSEELEEASRLFDISNRYAAQAVKLLLNCASEQQQLS